MENIIVAISNFPALFPIKLAIYNNDCLTCCAVLFVFIASFVSHLFENHKHGMVGIANINPNISYILNRFDILGVILVLLRFAYLIYVYSIKKLITNDFDIIIYLIVSSIFNIISEHDKYNAKLKKIYIVTHIIWHISIFSIMYLFLLRIYT